MGLTCHVVPLHLGRRSAHGMNLRREGVLRQGPCVTHRSRERPLADRQRENSSFGPQNTRDEVLPSVSMSLGDFFPRASFDHLAWPIPRF